MSRHGGALRKHRREGSEHRRTSVLPKRIEKRLRRFSGMR